jgi:hypothetical protein
MHPNAQKRMPRFKKKSLDIWSEGDQNGFFGPILGVSLCGFEKNWLPLCSFVILWYIYIWPFKIWWCVKNDGGTNTQRDLFYFWKGWRNNEGVQKSQGVVRWTHHEHLIPFKNRWQTFISPFPIHNLKLYNISIV